jgi:2TM domain
MSKKKAANTDPYEMARRQVKKKKAFYRHLSVYLVMGGFFYVLNMMTNPGHLWFYWPMLGWGLGLAMQYVTVFGIPGIVEEMDDNWEQKEIEKELKKMKNRANAPTRSTEDEQLELRKLEKRKTGRWDDEQLV